ncbi:uncharacterized protein LOC112083394 [Eutrema salsugineum]|uniref:uncharacterized protein LOC112083394 n=1 Tax=Eutrema salsugineum TaxID=72664 RepID=UPI000CED54D2|nr:uncharacterized protein LOC112083394 [Eutrema salsugineum]
MAEGWGQQFCNGVERFEEEAKGAIAIEYFTDLFKASDIGDVSESYKHFWGIAGTHVMNEVKQFFENGKLPQEWNHTQICLLPKIQNPNKMTDLRPMSLCSVTYKIISKVLCTRLKRFLPQLVSQTQGAFVAGRLISDNILIAHEMIHGLKTNPNCKEDFIAIKTDMSKAYDKVEWKFLEILFDKMGFDPQWSGWIMECIRSVSYTVLLNEGLHGHIQPERGIRQGDPLSPFLFILCAEALVHVMSRAEQEGKITGMRLTANCPPIQHLLFAEDSFFLCRANLRECTEFLRCLKLYGDASGQLINFQKSAITYGEAIDPYQCCLISNLLGIDKEGGDGKYLGLPECFSGSKQKLLAFIGEKLSKRLHGWYAKTLSLGGKEILLKSIAMALPHYFGKELLERGLMKSIGNGVTTHVWMEKWILDDHPRRPVNREIFMDLELKVSSLISPDGKWIPNRVNELFPPADAARIMDMPLGRVANQHIWAYTRDGAYSVKSGYWFAANHLVLPQPPLSPLDETRVALKQRIWKFRTEPKIKFFLWRVLSEALTVAERLSTRGMLLDMTCKLCNEKEETINHVLFRCPVAQQVWDLSNIHLPVDGFSNSLEGNMGFLFDIIQRQVVPTDLRHAIPWIIWGIWKNRNAALFAGSHETSARVLQRSKEEANVWTEANKPENSEDMGEAGYRFIEERWQAPPAGRLKCNLNVHWRNARSHCGGAWVVRDHEGNTTFHARDAFLRTPNRITGELKGVIWALQSLRDLRITNVTMALDCKEAYAAITKPAEWPRYRMLTEQINRLGNELNAIVFELESAKSNHIAQEIAKSVIRDGRLQSYLSIGGPAWLYERLRHDAQRGF